MNRGAAGALDLVDPLAAVRDEFVVDDPLIYMDGNSLGRLPRRSIEAINTTVAEEWGTGLVGSWKSEWVALPSTVGDLLASLVGAGPGEVLISDQTSVNLYKLAAAALERTGRADVVSDAANFPSDLYVLDGVAAARGGNLRLVEAGTTTDADAIAALVDDGVGLVALSHIDYRTAAVNDMGAISAVAHESGALALWDLSHSVGVYPVDLEGAGADLAVGCTYKYLNGGPGSPGFLYVRSGLQGDLRQPIQGWFGHADQFAFDRRYVPAPGVARFAVGTPPIVSLRGAEQGIRLVAEVGIDAARAKSVALTTLLIELADERLTDLGLTLVSPKQADDRGGHVALAHPAAWQIAQALVDRDVVPDFRAPDVIRLGPSPLYTRFTDVWDAVDILAAVVAGEEYARYPERRDIVT